MGTLSGDNNKLLMCGNPTKTTGTFYDAFTVDRAIFALQTVSSRDSKRTNKDNIASLDRKYGKDSNVVRVRVDGKFPEQEDDVFIPASWIEDSISTEMEKETALAFGVYVSESGEKIRDVRGVLTIDIGCDVARFGDDRTCITFKVNEVVQIDLQEVQRQKYCLDNRNHLPALQRVEKDILLFRSYPCKGRRWRSWRRRYGSAQSCEESKPGSIWGYGRCACEFRAKDQA